MSSVYNWGKMMGELNKTDKMYLDRVAKSPVTFTHAIDMTGRHTKLVRSTVSPSLQKHLHRLAVAGYLGEAVTGCGGHGQPPESTVTFTLTAMGRQALGLHKTEAPHVNRWTPPTDEELEREGIE